MNDPRPDLSTLLAHEAWVRRLARALVADEHTADEVVQQTWLNALLWPPRRGGELRGWLATVVRNVVRQRARGESRERVRQQRGAVYEVAPGGDVAERLELQAQVAAAVTALREADREVIVLRYFDDLPPRAIARRLDVPVATIKSRLARARARLASRLGPAFGGACAGHGALYWLAFGDTPAPRLARLAAGSGGRVGAPVPYAWMVTGGAAAIVAGALLMGPEAPPERGAVQVASAPRRGLDELGPPPLGPAPDPPPVVKAPVVTPARPSAPAAVAPVTAPEEPLPVEDAPPPLTATAPLSLETASADPKLRLVSTLEVLPRAADAPRGLALRVLLSDAAREVLAAREALAIQPHGEQLGSDRACGEVALAGSRLRVREQSAGVAPRRWAQADVFVQLEDVPDQRWKAPREAVTLDQRGCLFDPPVIGLLEKQALRVLNSDDTLHNIHAMAVSNRPFNNAMPAGIKPVVKEFKKAEQAIPIRCDVHPWMLAHAFVLSHPFFAVTDGAGDARVPTERWMGEWPGEWPGERLTLALWHPLVEGWTEVLEPAVADATLVVRLDVAR